MPAFPERHTRRRPIDPIPRWQPTSNAWHALRGAAIGFGLVVIATVAANVVYRLVTA